MPDRRYADEWLPSRFRLATLRVIAYVISRSLESSRPTSGAYLNREPGQHPLEANLLSIAYWLIPAAQFSLLAAFAGSRPRLVAPIAFLALLLVVPLAWVIVALLLSPVAARLSAITGRPTHDIQALITPSFMLAIAVISIVLNWPGAPLGWLWIGLTILEIISAATCFLLRNRFDALDRRLPSEAP